MREINGILLLVSQTDGCQFLPVTDLAFFGHALDQYHTEHEEAVAVEPETYLGLLMVDKKVLKEMLESSPLRCLEVRSDVIVMSPIMKSDECFQSNFVVLITQQRRCSSSHKLLLETWCSLF